MFVKIFLEKSWLKTKKKKKSMKFHISFSFQNTIKHSISPFLMSPLSRPSNISNPQFISLFLQFLSLKSIISPSLHILEEVSLQLFISSSIWDHEVWYFKHRVSHILWKIFSISFSFSNSCFKNRWIFVYLFSVKSVPFKNTHNKINHTPVIRFSSHSLSWNIKI